MDQDLYLPDVFRVHTHQQTPIHLVSHNVLPLLTAAMFASISGRLPSIEEGAKKKREEKGKGEVGVGEEDVHEKEEEVEEDVGEEMEN